MLSKSQIHCWISAAVWYREHSSTLGPHHLTVQPKPSCFHQAHTHLSNNEPPSLWQRVMNGELRGLSFSPLQVAGIQVEHGADRRRREQLRCRTIHSAWQDSVSRYCALNSLIFASQHGCMPKECVIRIHLFALSEPHWDKPLYVWQHGSKIFNSLITFTPSKHFIIHD